MVASKISAGKYYFDGRKYFTIVRKKIKSMTSSTNNHHREKTFQFFLKHFTFFTICFTYFIHVTPKYGFSERARKKLLQGLKSKLLKVHYNQVIGYDGAAYTDKVKKGVI